MFRFYLHCKASRKVTLESVVTFAFLLWMEGNVISGGEETTTSEGEGIRLLRLWPPPLTQKKMKPIPSPQ